MMRMPTIIVSDHGHGDIADLRLPRQFRLLQVGYADHVHAPAAVDVRFGLGRKLRSLHVEVGTATLPGHAHLPAGAFDHSRHLRTYRISEGDVGYDSVAEECVDAMAGAVEELVGNDEIQRLVFFLERTHGGDGNDAFYTQLPESVNIRAEVQLCGQDPVPAPVPRQKRYFAALQCAQDKGVRWIAEGRWLRRLAHISQSGHGVQTAATDDSDFRLRQKLPLQRAAGSDKLAIIQKQLGGSRSAMESKPRQ